MRSQFAFSLIAASVVTLSGTLDSEAYTRYTVPAVGTCDMYGMAEDSYYAAGKLIAYYGDGILCGLPRTMTKWQFPRSVSVMTLDDSPAESVLCNVVSVEYESDGTLLHYYSHSLPSTGNAFRGNKEVTVTPGDTDVVTNLTRTYWYLDCTMPDLYQGFYSAVMGIKVEEYDVDGN